MESEGQTTGVSIHNSPLGPQGRLPEQEFIIHNEAGAWYDLQGRKLAGRPTQKGVYINKGKKTGGHFTMTLNFVRARNIHFAIYS